jgi:methionyl-tRNA synthetase
MIQPVMPDTSDELYRQIGLNLDERSLDVDALARALAGDRDVAPGRSLFPRVEIGGAPAGRKEKGGRQKPKQPQKQPAAAKPETNDGLISFDDFKKVDLRVGRIDAAERVPKSDKLIKLSVTADRPRTIVAGVGKEFEPEDLVGRQVIVVANLAPAKLMGVTSEGMMLAATDEEGLTLLAPGRETKAGSRVS